jgi:hypothetical protein
MPWRATTAGGAAAADGALSTKAKACGNAAPSEPMQKKRASKLLRGNAQIFSILLITIYLLAVGAILAQHFPPGALPRNELPNTLAEI